MKIPNHLAIIPDGNRRWARQFGLAPWLGHYEGAKTLKRLLYEVVQPFSIKHFSLWIASFDNLEKRPKEEVDALCDLFEEYFTHMAEHKDVEKFEVGIRAFGEWASKFPERTVQAIERAQEATRNYSKYFLNFFMAYDGQREMVSAVQTIANKALKANPHFPVDSDVIQNHLWTADIPPVDLLIRTGVEGDPHLSGGFLMWQMAYAQLYFSPVHFPAFGPDELKKAIEDYSSRERRFGA